MFINEDGKITIIDFDDAKFGSAIYDVSILISTFFISKVYGVNFEGMHKFLDEYYGDDEFLKIAEVSLIKSCAIEWFDYLLGEGRLNSSLNISFNVKRELIIKNL